MASSILSENYINFRTTFTLLAGIFLITGGLALRRFASISHNKKNVNEPLFKHIFGRSRISKMRQFRSLAKGVLADVEQALYENPEKRHEARALLPLVAEVRKRGELLITNKEFCNLLWKPVKESKLMPLVNDLNHKEQMLRSLPRPKLTIDEILAGKTE